MASTMFSYPKHTVCRRSTKYLFCKCSYNNYVLVDYEITDLIDATYHYITKTKHFFKPKHFFDNTFLMISIGLL